LSAAAVGRDDSLVQSLIAPLSLEEEDGLRGIPWLGVNQFAGRFAGARPGDCYPTGSLAHCCASSRQQRAMSSHIRCSTCSC